MIVTAKTGKQRLSPHTLQPMWLYEYATTLMGNITRLHGAGQWGIMNSAHIIVGVSMVKNMILKPEICVGIDCAKKEHVVYIQDNFNNKYLKGYKIQNTISDMELLISKILEIEGEIGEKCKVTINLEATSVYHLPIYSVLSKFFKVNIWQPKQAKEQDKKNIRRTKNDQRSARILATLHWIIDPTETQYDDRELYDNRELVRTMYKYKDLMINAKKSFRRTLMLIHPRFDQQFKDPYKAVPWAILRSVPSVEEIIQLESKGIQKIIDNAKKGQRCHVTGKKVVDWANDTIRNDIMVRGAKIRLWNLMDDIEYYQNKIELLRKELSIYWDTIKCKHFLHTHPALSNDQAVAIHCEFGGLDRFTKADKAVAFTGQENFVEKSGESINYNGRMTKAGSPTLRRILWEAISSPKKYIPKLTEHMTKLKKKGKHRFIALHSTSKKLVRQLWALEAHKQKYQYP